MPIKHRRSGLSVKRGAQVWEMGLKKEEDKKTAENAEEKNIHGCMKSLLDGRRVLLQCFFGCYCVGLHRLFPIEVVCCLDEGGDFDLIAEECRVDLRTVESPGKERKNWIGAGIDVVFERLEPSISARLASHDRASWFVVSSPPSHKLEAFCRHAGLAYAGPTAASAVPFQPKAALLEAIRDMRLPAVQGLWVAPRDLAYRSLAHRLGRVFVIQRDCGAAGSGTFLVSGPGDLSKVIGRLPDEPVRASPFLGHLSFNINAAVVGTEICVGFPNVQLSGVTELGAPWGGYCGNDYSAAGHADKTLIQQIQDQTEIVGNWLARRGFQGIYGLDFVVCESDGRPHAVDLNPRWQGSTALSTQSELEQGRLPLAAADLGFRCGALTSRDIRTRIARFREPLDGSQLCLRLPHPNPHYVTGTLLPGIYRHDHECAFVRGGISLSDCRERHEWLLTGGVPRQGTLVEGGAWLARIYSKSPVSDGKRSSILSAEAAQIAHGFFALFDLQPLPKATPTKRTQC